MNHDEKFQQRWEFRRTDDVGDSSNDSEHNSIGEPTDKRKLIPGLILSEYDEVSNTPRHQHHGTLDTNDGVQLQSVQAAKRKTKSSKKKNVMKNKSKKCSVKQRKVRKTGNIKAIEVEMLEELKIFADSLILELKVAREKMFAEMREQTRKLVASSPVWQQIKNVKHSHKNKVQPQNGKPSVKHQNFSGGSMERNMKSKMVFNEDELIEAGEADINRVKVLELWTTNEIQESERIRLSMMTRSILSKDSDQVVSSPYLTLPTVIPKPQLQSHRNSIPSDDRIPAGVPGSSANSDMEMGKFTENKDYYRGIPAFQSELFGTSSHINCKSASFLGQNFSETVSAGIGFPILPHQMLHNHSDLSSLTYPENASQDNSMVGLRTHAR